MSKAKADEEMTSLLANLTVQVSLNKFWQCSSKAMLVYRAI